MIRALDFLSVTVVEVADIVFGETAFCPVWRGGSVRWNVDSGSDTSGEDGGQSGNQKGSEGPEHDVLVLCQSVDVPVLVNFEA